jgi:hypothetical protein
LLLVLIRILFILNIWIFQVCARGPHRRHHAPSFGGEGKVREGDAKVDCFRRLYERPEGEGTNAGRARGEDKGERGEGNIIIIGNNTKDNTNCWATQHQLKK